MKWPKSKKQPRFKELANGYRFDRWLFRALAASFLLITLVTVAIYGFEDKWYYHCPNDTAGYCSNPFIDQVGNCIATDTFLCDFDGFAPGFTYGRPPAWIISNFGLLFLALTVVVFLINHFKHNKRFAR